MFCLAARLLPVVLRRASPWAILLSFTLGWREVFARWRCEAIPLRRRRALVHSTRVAVHRAGALRAHSFKMWAALLEVRHFSEARTPVSRACIHATFALLLKTCAVLRWLRTETIAMASTLCPTTAHHFEKMLHLLRAWSSSEVRTTTLRTSIHAALVLLCIAGAVWWLLRAVAPVVVTMRALHSILLAVATEVLPLVVPVAVMSKVTTFARAALLRLLRAGL